MSLKLYSTLTREKETFKPLEEGKVRLYLCGPTVYDFLHIGNFRGAIFFNMVRNWLEKIGYDVTFVYNYTDVDDKIIKRAIDEGVESTVISERYIKEFEADFNRLGLKAHDHNPKVTEFMPEIIQYVVDLIEKDKAYEVEGEVFYSIDSFEDYGKLSGKKLEDLNAGQRVDVDKRKKNPFDFVLWKPSKEGEPSWDSPWGKGRPGWHIECSAMIKSILGNTIDIHGGGIDLIFPHHENEIAQAQGCTGEKYCNHWMHNEFINMKGEKMSKSLGNVLTARNFMDKYDPEILKYLMLSAHYRTRFNINDEKINQCVIALSRIYSALKVAKDAIENFEKSDSGKTYKALAESYKTAEQRIAKSMNDDFNTNEALSHIFEVVRAFNSQSIAKKAKDPNAYATAISFKEWITTQGAMMALFQRDPDEFLHSVDEILLKEKNIERAKVDDLIALRQKARDDKNWADADKYRDELQELGIEFQDTPNGPVWHVKV